MHPLLKYSSLPFLSILLLVACSQPRQTDPSATDKKIFDTARRANDFSTALNAAYRIVYASDSNYAYYDSIALIYQTLGNYAGALEIAKDGLEKHPSLLLDKISAHGMMKTGKYTDAVIKYQELIETDAENALRYQYAIGESFFYMQNYQSCLEYMNLVASNDKSALIDLEMQTDKGVQQVPYKLAALNTIGYVFMVTEKFDEAEKVYQDVLGKMPDFQLANNNYQLLRELKKSR